MLRIKNDVDLKVLENYEFKREMVKTNIGDIPCYVKTKTANFRYKKETILIAICEANRNIIIKHKDSVEDLYDMISDGIVEKVE